MNPKLESISAKASELLAASIREESDRILEAWDDCTDEAQSNEKENPTLALSFSIKLDLGKNRMTTKLSYGVKRILEHACEIPDPAQPELLGGAQ